MRKLNTFFVVLFCVIFLSISTFPMRVEAVSQSDYDNMLNELIVQYDMPNKKSLDKFEINSSMKKITNTFDESKVFSGVAERGTEIVFTLYTKDVDGEWVETSVYNVSVGFSGLFSQTVPLSIGENKVTIYAKNNDKSTVMLYVFYRAEKEIKDEMLNVILFPKEDAIVRLTKINNGSNK